MGKARALAKRARATAQRAIGPAPIKKAKAMARNPARAKSSQRRKAMRNLAPVKKANGPAKKAKAQAKKAKDPAKKAKDPAKKAKDQAKRAKAQEKKAKENLAPLRRNEKTPTKLSPVKDLQLRSSESTLPLTDYQSVGTPTS